MWLSGKLNIIKVTADPSVLVRVYFKKVGSTEDFEEILVEPYYLGGRTWAIEMTFGEGVYVIKATNETQGGEAFTTITVNNPMHTLEDISSSVWNRIV